jgi:hypothetical protein
MNKKYFKNQSGLILILLILVLPVIITMMTLLFDLGKLFIISKQSNNLADLTALAGTRMLAKANPTIVYSVPADKYRNIKPAIKSLAQESKILGVTAVTNETFNSGLRTYFPNELPNYNYDSLVASSSSLATLTITVRRGVRCFDSLNQEHIIDIETHAGHWCLANSVNSTVAISNSSPFFGNFIGVTNLGGVTRTATAHLRPVPDACGVPSCTDYEPYLSDTSGNWQVDPAVTPPCFTPYPTSTPTPAPTFTPTITPTPQDTATPTPTPLNTATPTATPVNTATNTPLPAPTNTNTPIPPPTDTPIGATGPTGATGVGAGVGAD